MTRFDRRPYALLFIAAALLAPARADDAPATKPDALATLARWLSGHFSSAAQAQGDPDYLDIHLHAAVIWQDRTDGPWLYVEQARGDLLERPYRQRVYHLSQGDDGTLASAVYELPGDPLAYAGAWADVSKLADLTPQQLIPRQGCTVYLSFDGTRFTGETRGTACASTLRGASHATSEVTIDASGLSTWDRGYDADGKQVWGAEKGPYRFDRLP